MSTASKGRDAEWLVRDLLRRYNYFVFRARASKGPADLLALNAWELLVVAVRMERWPSPRDRARLRRFETSPFVRAMFARVHRGKVEFAVEFDGEIIRVAGPLPAQAYPIPGAQETNESPPPKHAKG